MLHITMRNAYFDIKQIMRDIPIGKIVDNSVFYFTSFIGCHFKLILNTLG